jgi:hypothetical protein
MPAGPFVFHGCYSACDILIASTVAHCTCSTSKQKIHSLGTNEQSTKRKVD